jgi:hypothetical protein
MYWSREDRLNLTWKTGSGVFIISSIATLAAAPGELSVGTVALALVVCLVCALVSPRLAYIIAGGNKKDRDATTEVAVLTVALALTAAPLAYADGMSPAELEQIINSAGDEAQGADTPDTPDTNSADAPELGEAPDPADDDLDPENDPATATPAPTVVSTPVATPVATVEPVAATPSRRPRPRPRPS